MMKHIRRKPGYECLLSIPIIICVFSVMLCCFSQEIITISTYYSSPQGIYAGIRLFPVSDPAGFGGIGSICSNDGEMYYSNTLHEPFLCNTGTWVVLGSGGALWSSYIDSDTNTVNLYPNTDTWNVAIGTSNTNTYRLNVEGKFKASNIYANRFSVTPCNKIQCDATLNFPVGRFTAVPVVICTGEPVVCNCGGCGDCHSNVACSIKSVDTTQVSVRYGTNRSSAGHMRPQDGDRILNILAMEPTE